MKKLILLLLVLAIKLNAQLTTNTTDIKVQLAKERILTLANTNFALGQKQAQSLANFVWGNTYYEYTLLPNGANNARVLNNKISDTETSNNVIDNNFLSIIPNPTSETTNISYKLPNNSLTGKIIVSDVNGKIVQYYDVIASLNTITFNTNNLLYGVYFVTLYTNNKLVSSKKLVIIK